MDDVKERYDWCPYIAIVEDTETGRTYEQPFYDYMELGELIDIVFGDGYRVVTIY